MAGPNGGKCTIEMGFYGADGQAGDVGDLGELELIEEAQQKDIALALGELSDALPDEGELFVRDESRLERAVAVGDVRGDIRDIDGGLGDALPEAEAVGPGVVADEIQGDPHEPGRDGAVSTEAGAGVPGAHKGVLRQRLGHVAVADGDEMEAEDALLVCGDEGVDVIERRGDRLLRDGKALGDDGL